MKVLLNTLYVNTPKAYLTKDGMNVVVSVDQKEVARIPIINLQSIYSFTYAGASPGLMKLCADNNVALSFYTPSGHFISRSQGPVSGNVLLRKRQYCMHDDEAIKLSLSRLFIGAKIHNSRCILQRYVRDNGSDADVVPVIKHLKEYKRRLIESTSDDEIRGIEGMAAREYFSVFDNMITRCKEDFKFEGRNRRPPRDRVNALLSFVYSLITNEVASALEGVGLDPYVGFMHVLRPGRASLALDLIEEMRAYLGDRLVLSMINRRQITAKDFVDMPEGSCLLTTDGRKKVIAAWQERKKDEIIHPFLYESIQLGLLPHVQAMLLARNIRGDLNGYPVFLLKS